MSVLAKGLLGPLHATNAQTTQYTVPVGTRTILDKFTGTNTSGSAATLTVNLVPNGASPASSNVIVSVKTLQANESYTFPELVGHIMNTGDMVSTLASASSAIVIRASGREVS